MPDQPSPSAPAPDRPHSASTLKFLAMIPKGLGQALESPPPATYRPHTAEQQTTVALSQPEESEALSWPSGEQTAHPPLPIPTVRLQGETVEIRSQAIVQAAEDCGRLHSERAKYLYELLVTAALAQHVAIRPDLKTTPNRITYFIVVDELAPLLGVSRSTVYRALDDLKAGDLVDRRPWYTSSSLAKGGTVAAGVVIDMVLTPAQGTATRVRAEYLKQRYRNLDAGRTAWKWMTEVKEAIALAEALEAEAAAMVPSTATVGQLDRIKERAAKLRQSISLSGIDAQINHLLRWTLDLPNSTPVMLTVSARQDVIYRLGDLVGAPPQQRGALIDERVQALCLATGDGSRNLSFWRWLRWRMVELEFVQPGCMSALMTSLFRLMTDIREWGPGTERPLRNAGALFVSRLKKSGWWDELKGIGVT